jgi:hypothetical protein
MSEMPSTGSVPDLAALRDAFHDDIAREALFVRANQTKAGTAIPVYSNADGHSEPSSILAAGMAARMPKAEAPEITGQAAGNVFERLVLDFLDRALPLLPMPGALTVEPGRFISNFAQYGHLAEIQRLVEETPELEATLGGDYLVKPDLVVFWAPLTEDELDLGIPCLSPNCASVPGAVLPILHASVSCKWSIRSDRVQNTRTEALNLVRNRKGRTPHIAAVTMEPEPERIAAIAIGTGDIDCVYHGALWELREAAVEAASDGRPAMARSQSRLEMMIESRRLRDIADLPVDLLA